MIVIVFDFAAVLCTYAFHHKTNMKKAVLFNEHVMINPMISDRPFFVRKTSSYKFIQIRIKTFEIDIYCTHMLHMSKNTKNRDNNFDQSHVVTWHEHGSFIKWIVWHNLNP